MLLDYAYNKRDRVLSISYVSHTGGKNIINFNASRFKSYYSSPSGKFKNWDGSNCDIRWTDNPTNFDIRTFMEELNKLISK